MQPLIDKTASYVAKNGTDMLAVVKKRDPEGFAFLNPTNKYNLVSHNDGWTIFISCSPGLFCCSSISTR